MAKWFNAWCSLSLILTMTTISAQEYAPLKISIQQPKQVTVGDTVELLIRVDVDEGWYVYAADADNEVKGMTAFHIGFLLPKGMKLIGNVRLPDPIYHEEYTVYKGLGNVFKQRVLVEKVAGVTKPIIRGTVQYQACDAQSCLPPTTERFEVLLEK
ncbi:protein-disulfide reductase DsbD domain-containing protein [Sphingobacterium tabacisoli]|uniref:Protein-disulfide reductase DsbD domain-containing protein n=1 Tax=Sphingobacterium tabacisoli TaxID=2044855 RepID=A0ABW5L0Q6_9SPHI|nr:protein-disulfide reductase DsbD domain-containing protein [Sphingobacterium tabacisoli]